LSLPHARFAAACFISLTLTALSLASAGDDSDALLLVEISIPVLVAAFVSIALLDKHYAGGT